MEFLRTLSKNRFAAEAAPTVYLLSTFSFLWLALLLNPVQGMSQELGGILQVQLFLYPLPVGADGLHAQVEPVADLADAQAFTDELEDLDLPVSQGLERGR